MTDYNEVSPTNKPGIKSNDGDSKPKLTKIVSKDAKKIKKGLLERAVISFIGPDGIPAVSHYVMREVVSPAIKNIIVDSVKSGIDAMMFGQDGRSHGNSYNKATGYYSQGRSRNNNRTNYNNASSGRGYRNEGPSEDVPVRGNRFNSEDYTLPDRNEALSVLDALNDQIESYGMVSVADFYDLIGIASDFVDHSWGWSDLSDGRVRSYRDTFVISLPAPGKVK